MTPLEILTAELVNDPLARGYAGMADAQVAESMNLIDRPALPVERMTGTEVFELITPADYTAIEADPVKLDRLRVLLSLGEINVAEGSQGRALLLWLFPAGSDTRAALAAFTTRLQARWEELGLPRELTPRDVANVRAQ